MTEPAFELISGRHNTVNPREESLAEQERATALTRLRRRLAQQDEMISELRQAAFRDPVTGAANRGCLSKVWAIVEPQDPISILSIDVDRFHRVNEAFGRRGGDAVLRELVRQMASCIRWDDTVIRTGSNGFAVVLPDAIEEDAISVGERIRTRVERLRFVVHDSRFQITVRVGAAGRQTGETWEEVLLRAERAVRIAAGEGGNRVARD